MSTEDCYSPDYGEGASTCQSFWDRYQKIVRRRLTTKQYMEYKSIFVSTATVEHLWTTAKEILNGGCNYRFPITMEHTVISM